MADPELDYNPQNGKCRVRLVNGDPVPTDSPEYEMRTVWCEAPGWPMDESQRRGPLSEEFPETTRGTPGRLAASLEDRCAPLISDRVLDSVVCERVEQIREGAIAFVARYTRAGKPAEPATLEIGT